MSNFKSKAFNPKTKRVEEAEFIDDYFGQHLYGVRFVGSEKVWREDDVENAALEALADQAQELKMGYE